MRSCKDCGRNLPEDAFSTGSNWKQCKKCKGHEVLLRKKQGSPAALAFPFSGHRWFQDYYHEQLVYGRAARRACAMTRRAMKDYKARDPEWPVPADENLSPYPDPAALDRKYRAQNPELWRARERAKRARNPELYRALSQANSARQRSRRPSSPVPLNVIWAAAEGKCGICGDPCSPDWWEVDHVVPLAKGGRHELSNLAPAHPYCNRVKGSKTNDTLNTIELRRRWREWEQSEVGLRAKSSAPAPCGTNARWRNGCRCEACFEAHQKFNFGRTIAGGGGGKSKPRPRRHYPDRGEVEYERLRANGFLQSVAIRESGISYARARQLEGERR